MANSLDTMDLKQIITLKIGGCSNRKIVATTGISRNTVKTYMKRFKVSEYTLKELMNFDSHALNHPGFTFQYHYREYRQAADNPYSYTQFMDHYGRKYAKVKGSVKLEHEAGNEMVIDYAGKHLHIIDKQSGELMPVAVFVPIFTLSI